MTHEQQLREQRQALNAAINNHDLQTTTSFLHPDFVAQGTDGHSYNRQEAVQQLEQMLQPSMNLHSQVDVEHVEVSGESATLRVCRTETGRMDRPAVFWGFLAAAAWMAYMAISTVVGGVPDNFAYQRILVWVGVAGAAVGFVCFIVGAFSLGRRSMHQTQRPEETWRRVDGRWLLAEERQLSGAIMKPRNRFIEVVAGAAVALVAVVAVGAYEAWSDFTEPGTEFQRSGNPALKLEVRRASTKEVDGWKASTTSDDPEGKTPFHVSPDAELSNADVLSTRAHFQPSNLKAVSRWKGGVKFLIFSVVLFVISWRSKDFRRWCGIAGVVCLLIGLGLLWHGLTSTAERFEQQGSWQVVIRFNDAGTKKLADLTASMLDGRNEQTKSYPSKHVAFLIDGELTFVAPVWGQNTEGLYYLAQAHLVHDPLGVGLSEEGATRLAKGIAGP
jgi:hypothetical protein